MARKSYHNPEYDRAYAHEYQQRDATKIIRKAWRRRPKLRAKQYGRDHPGVSIKEAERWFAMEDRTCWICLQGGANCLDHDHETKIIRGWTHKVCNFAEGYIKSCPAPRQALLTLLSKVQND